MWLTLIFKPRNFDVQFSNCMIFFYLILILFLHGNSGCCMGKEEVFWFKKGIQETIGRAAVWRIFETSTCTMRGEWMLSDLVGIIACIRWENRIFSRRLKKHDFGREKSNIFGREHKHQNFWVEISTGIFWIEVEEVTWFWFGERHHHCFGLRTQPDFSWENGASAPLLRREEKLRRIERETPFFYEGRSTQAGFWWGVLGFFFRKKIQQIFGSWWTPFGQRTN